MFIHTKMQIFWLKILNIIIEYFLFSLFISFLSGIWFCCRCCIALLCFTLLLPLWNRMKTIVTTKAHRYIISMLMSFFSFSVFILIPISHFGCVCALKLSTSSFETQKFTCTLMHISRSIHIHEHTHTQAHVKIHANAHPPSNKWSRTNKKERKKERANAQQKHPTESFSSYACQMRNDTELDEYEAHARTQRADGWRRKRKMWVYKASEMDCECNARHGGKQKRVCVCVCMCAIEGNVDSRERERETVPTKIRKKVDTFKIYMRQQQQQQQWLHSY